MIHHTLARYALASVAAILAQLAILLALDPPIGEFSGGLFLCGQPFLWLALIALPSGWLGEQYLRETSRLPRWSVWPLMALLHFGATFLLCNFWYALFAAAVDASLPWTEFVFAMLPFAALNTVSGLVFWAVLSVTRRWRASPH